MEPDEVGKIFAIVGTFQALLPFGSGPLFGFLYRDTVAKFPAAFLLVVAGFKLIEGIVVFTVFIMIKMDQRKMKAQNFLKEAEGKAEVNELKEAFLKPKTSEKEGEESNTKVARTED